MKPPLGLLALLTLSLFVGCATQEPFERVKQSVDVSLPPESFQRLGPVSGVSCRNVVLRVFSLSSPTVYEAELDARAKEPGTDLIFEKSIYAETQTVVPFVFTRRCIALEGIAIRLTGRGES